MNGKAVTTVLFLAGLLTACSGSPPSNPGLIEGTVAPCPERPNCVSSRNPGGPGPRAAAPLTYRSSAGEAMADLKRVVGSLRGASIVTESPPYLHAEVRSLLFGFVDDVEFALDDAAKIIHVRSASRIGYWDFGVNRRRVERIRSAWERR